jgi:hypothetical protein
MGLFGTAKTVSPTEKEVALMVTKYFERRHLDITGHELKADEGLGWWIAEGSAKVYIFVLEDRKGQVVRITAPILYFPEERKEEFFQRLLEINRDLSGVAIATFKNVVLVSAQRSTRGLDQEELNDLIWSVSFVADKIDDELAQEFGAKPYTDADG